MSHFHFPRLHFSGKALIDPATGNNNYHYPLVNYEPISGSAVLPPRIYLDSIENSSIAKNNLSDHRTYLKKDQDDNSYIELTPISEPSIFKKWMSSPMGSLSIDKDFHQLYKNILTDKDSIPLFGLCPAYWNYYGTMNFSLLETKVEMIQVIKHKIPISYQHLPPENPLSKFLGAELAFTFKNGKTSANMIDVSPTLSLYSQVFCSRITLTKDGITLMDGKPLKGSLRQMNVNRVENDQTITGSSGSFYQTIPLSNIQTKESKEILDFFSNHMQAKEDLQGITLRYDLSEVSENINPDYEKLGTKSNPAELHINGTLAPYLEGELISHAPGRRLDYLSPYNNKYYLGSCFAHYQKELELVSIDMIGSLPQIKKGNNYELAELDELNLVLRDKNTEHEIATINEINKPLTIQQLKLNGGIFDFPIENLALIDLLNKNRGTLELHQNKDILLKEKEIRIISDQTGMYADQHDKEHVGFLSNHAKRELCIFQVLQKGKPALEAIEVMHIKVTVLPYGRGHSMKVLDDIQSIKHGQVIHWSTEEPGQFFHILIPKQHETMPLDINHHMIKTGEFINLRILPSYKIKKSEDASIEFKDVYEKILQNFDLIYPSSSIITPFTEDHLSKSSQFIRSIMDEKYWSEYLYMPSSRDLPKGKRKLMFDWISQQKKIN